MFNYPGAMGTYAFVRRISSGIDVRTIEKMADWVALITGVYSLLCLTAMDVIGKRGKRELFILSPQVSGQKFIRNSVFIEIWADLLEKPTCSYQSGKTKKISEA